jgi:hypothetical protein
VTAGFAVPLEHIAVLQSMDLIVARLVGPSCCPSHTYAEMSLAEDCQVQVTSLPTCADPSWNLFMDAYMFCCEPGYVGIQGDSCQSTVLTFSAGAYAATVSLHLFFLAEAYLPVQETQANTAQPPATRPPPIGSGSATTTATAGGAAGTPGASSSGTSTTSSGSVKSTSGANKGGIVGYSEQIVLGGVVAVAGMLL